MRLSWLLFGLASLMLVSFLLVGTTDLISESEFEELGVYLIIASLAIYFLGALAWVHRLVKLSPK